MTEHIDPENHYGVGVSHDGEVVVLHAHLRLTRARALNLCAWVSVLAGLSDDELLAARRAVEAGG